MHPVDITSVTAWRCSSAPYVVNLGASPFTVDPEVEAVQVHRVVEGREVDPSPVERVTLRHLERRGVWPGLPVDCQGRLAKAARARRVEREPPGDDEDAIVRSDARVRRIDQDRAVELAVLRRASTTGPGPVFPA